MLLSRVKITPSVANMEAGEERVEQLRRISQLICQRGGAFQPNTQKQILGYLTSLLPLTFVLNDIEVTSVRFPGRCSIILENHLRSPGCCCCCPGLDISCQQLRRYCGLHSYHASNEQQPKKRHFRTKNKGYFWRTLAGYQIYKKQIRYRCRCKISTLNFLFNPGLNSGEL